MHEAAPIALVTEFHKTFKHPILERPAIPSKERCALRISLLSEELKEFQTAIDEGNIVDVADALCDIQYVLAGAILEFGLASKFKQLFDEVHRSNMSKACSSQDEANLTISRYKEHEQCDSYVKEENKLFLVYRALDHKTLKSINYSPANLQSILQNDL